VALFAFHLVGFSDENALIAEGKSSVKSVIKIVSIL